MQGSASDRALNLIEGSHTVANQRRDFTEWHRGRSSFVFWALDVDTPAVNARVASAATHLDGLLLDAYGRQPHVTLDLCGFPAAQPMAEDEFAMDLIERQCAALRLARVPEFDIEVGGLGSFSSAPFLGVTDRDGQIAAVRTFLAVDGQPRLFGDYVPHVTVGLYAGAWPAGEVAVRLAGFPASAQTRCRIERISLMAYQPAEIGGPLSRVADYWLASGELRWHAALF